jgi:ABC-2 type transport system permease protein
MTAPTVATVAPGQQVTLPGVIRLGLARGGVELKEFVRNKEAVIFSFGFPALLLILLGSIFRGDDPPSGVTSSQIFSAGMIAYGIVSTAFITMGVGISMDREDGTLKRLRGTPLTAPSYFIGKLTLVAVSVIAEVVIMLAVAMIMFDMPLPSEAGRWLTFAWLLVLSVIACTLLGIAASSLAKSGRSAGVVLNVPSVALQFLSGIFVQPITALPAWMLGISSLFPVKWMGQGFRSVFLPDNMAVREAAGTWEHATTALVLAAWCVIGLVLSLMTFRWSNSK